MIKLPIILLDSNDIILFPTVMKAQIWPELQDLDGSNFYDAEGNLLEWKPSVVKIQRRFLSLRWVSTHKGITITEIIPNHDGASTLRRSLIRYLQARKHASGDLENAPLSILVTMAGKYMPWKMD